MSDLTLLVEICVHGTVSQYLFFLGIICITAKKSCYLMVIDLNNFSNNFIEKIKGCVDWPKIDILFAPHHGRATAKVPEEILKHKLSPKVVVIGEARSDELNYYKGYNRILQNSAKDITFNCRTGWVDVFTSSDTYVPNDDFLICQDGHGRMTGDRYIGSFEVG